MPSSLVSISSTWRRCCSLRDTRQIQKWRQRSEGVPGILNLSILQSHDNFGTLGREHRSSRLLRTADDPRVWCAHYRTGPVLCGGGKSGRRAEQRTGRDALLEVPGSGLALRQAGNVM